MKYSTESNTLYSAKETIKHWKLATLDRVFTNKHIVIDGVHSRAERVISGIPSGAELFSFYYLYK